MGNPPRSPCAPVGAFWPALNGRGCASLLPRVGQIIGGNEANPLDYSNMTKNVGHPFLQAAALKPQPRAKGTSGAPSVPALSIEFVAKRQELHRVDAAIPAATAGALKGVTGLAGCLVMISDQEARLFTVVTFWAGDDYVKRCRQNVRWGMRCWRSILTAACGYKPWLRAFQYAREFAPKRMPPVNLRWHRTFFPKLKPRVWHNASCIGRSESE